MLDFVYAVPLIAATSLVYAASRYEAMHEVLANAARIALWISGAMAAIFIVMMVIF
ncbi:MAG: hypothetical protein Q4D62_15145 [Planctomycetia bacterium]|nr:hypothetical protein [Planctomycetia bacterium]